MSVQYMRNILSLSLAVLLLSVTSCKKKPEDMIANINKEQAKIDAKLADYTLRSVDDIVSQDHGVIKGYYKEKEVKKVVAEHYGEKGRKFDAFYFDDGMLIMVVSEEYIYNRSMKYTEEVARASGDSVWYDDSKTKREVNKYYFDDNKLIKWTGANKNDVPSNVADFTQKEPLLLANAILALKQLKTEE